jgi:hypothetical protein
VAVAFDAVGPSSSGSTGTTSPRTWSHTAASGAALLVFITIDQATNSSTVTATYGGVSMTQLKKQGAGDAVGSMANGGLFCFGLLSAGNGSAQTVSVTFTGTSDVQAAGSLSFTGAGAFGTPAVVSSNATSATVTVPSVASTSVVAAGVADGGSAAATVTTGTNRFYAAQGSSGNCGSCGAATNTGYG